MLAISTPPQSLHPPLGSRGICTHFSCVSLFVWSDRLKAQTPRSDNSLPWQISTGRCRSRFKSQCFFYSTHFGLMFLWSLYNAPLYCVFFPNGVINPNTTFPAVPYSFKLSFNKFQIQRKRCLSGGFPLISFCGLSSPWHHKTDQLHRFLSALSCLGLPSLLWN